MIPVITAHPAPDSFTAAIASAVVEALADAGAEPCSVDLYRCSEGKPFPPVMEREELRRKTSLDPVVQKQMRLVEEARGFVIVHPDWWGGPPAVLKGWLDRVLRSGTAYELPEGFGRQSAQGLLSGKKALVAAAGDAETPGLLEEFWLERVWKFCGVEAELRYFASAGESGPGRRKKFIAETARRSRELLV